MDKRLCRAAAFTVGVLVFSLQIRGYSPPTGDDQSLLLRVSGNGRYLVDHAGRPFVVAGDSPWSLIAQPGPEEIERYLEDRQKKGFNSIIVNLIEHKFSNAPPRTRAGLAPFSEPGDFSTPDKAYFDFAHSVIRRAGEHGIVVWLAPAYLGYGGGDEGFFREIKAGGREKLRAYGRFVGRRFRDLPNLVWMVGGDYTPEKSDQWVITDLATAIREEDRSHLMTAHHSPESSAVAAFGEQEWLSVNTVYSYEKLLFHRLMAEYRRRPVRPFVLLETTYEGEHDSTPDQIRRQAYWAILAGACGHFFGNNPIWHFDGPGLYPANGTWQQALDSAGSRDMAILRKLFSGLPWPELIPDESRSVLADGQGDGTATALTACTSDKKLSVTYFPSTGTDRRALTLALGSFPGQVKARWYNPTRGSFTEMQGSPFSNAETRQLYTPGNNGTGSNDWVLVLESR